MSQSQVPPQPFRFIFLKTHTSNEWLADRGKRYRTVFDVGEIAYLHAGLSFHNLEFGRKEWEANIMIRCFTVGENWETLDLVCDVDKAVTVDKESPVMTIHEGWGSPNIRGFWQPGTYQWIASINGEEVGKSYFHIQSVGLVTPFHNPYMKVLSLRLFEDDRNPKIPAARRYLSTFHATKTRYVWAEITLENLVKDRGWMYELDFKFFTASRDLKGTKVEHNYMDLGQRHMTIVGGWGNSTQGTWHPGFFTLEVAFMDQVVAILPFEVGLEFQDDLSDGHNWRTWSHGQWLQGY